MYGREAFLPADVVYPPVDLSETPFDSGPEYVKFLRESLTQSYGVARKNLHRSALRQARNYDVRAQNKPEFMPGDLVRYYYVREKAGNKFHRCYIGPYKILSRESEMNYKICGKLRDSGKEDIRIVHVDHLIHYEKDRAELFPNYSPFLEMRDTSHKTIKSEVLPKISSKPLDIFRSESSEDELELQSNLTSPSAFTKLDKYNRPTSISSRESSDSSKTSAGRSNIKDFRRRYPKRTRKKPRRFGLDD